MRSMLIILMVILYMPAIHAQTDSILPLRFSKKIIGSFVGFTTDNLGNIYTINQANQIKKLNANGDSIAVYNDVKRFGSIYLIDAANPLKVLVYYKDFATIVVLDRLLNVRNIIDLRKQNIFQVSAVATSYDGNFWLYDNMDSRIKKIDDYGKVLLASTDFRQILEVVPQPDAMYDRDGQLYLYDANTGVLVFDYYGAYKSRLPLKGVTDLQIIDKNTVIARKGNKVVLYKPLTFQTYYFNLNNAADDFMFSRFTGNLLYILTKKGEIEIFETP